jgi:hypothetical protein
MSSLIVETMTGGAEIIERLSDEWQEMLKGIVSRYSPYGRPEWILASLRAYAPQAKVCVIVVRRHGTLCAVLSLVEQRGKFAGLPARLLRAPLTMSGVGIDIPCTLFGTEKDEAIRLVWKEVQARKRWDVVELPSVFQDAAIERLPWFAQKDGHRTGSWSQPVIALFVIPQGPAANKGLGRYPRHPKLRSKIRQREARLATLGTARLVRTEKDGALDLERFYEMEARGWKGREKSAIISDPRSRQFFDEVTREAEKSGHLCLYALELDGKAIAAHIGFTYDGRYWAAKSTYDEDYFDYDPGHLIVNAILRDCSERGISEYIMGVREDWKMEWTQDVIKRTCQCIFNRGLWAQTLYAVRFPLRRKLSGWKAFRGAGKMLASFARQSTREGPGQTNSRRGADGH